MTDLLWLKTQKVTAGGSTPSLVSGLVLVTTMTSPAWYLARLGSNMSFR